MPLGAAVGTQIKRTGPLDGLPPKHKLLHEGIEVKRLDEKQGAPLNRYVLTLTEGRFGTFLLLSKKRKKSLKKRKGGTYHAGKGRFFAIDIETLKKAKRGNGLKNTSQDDDRRSFCIYYRGDRAVGLSATSHQDREEILYALDYIIAGCKSPMVEVSSDLKLMRTVWNDALKDESNTIIALDEINNVMDIMNFHIEMPKLLVQYENFRRRQGLEQKTTNKGLTFDEFVAFMHQLKRDSWHYKPANQIWNDLFGKNSTFVSAEDFREKFLRNVQEDFGITIQDVQKMFQELNEMDTPLENNDAVKGCIDRHRFEIYLSSTANEAFDPYKARLDSGSLTQPLSHYYINSSHNTFLTDENKSCTELYLSALMEGVRCLDMEVWDAESETERGRYIPVVFSGNSSAQSKVPFKTIIEAINFFLEQNPFSYPIILAVENHCTINSQEMMAKILVETLGKKLYMPDPSLTETLDSPEMLRGQVVIMGKLRALYEYKDQEMEKPDSNDEQYITVDNDDKSVQLGESAIVSAMNVIIERDSGVEVRYEANLPVGGSLNNTAAISTKGEVSRENGDHIIAGEETRQAMRFEHERKTEILKSKIAPELASVTLLHRTKFKHWEESISYPCFFMHAFADARIKEFLQENMSETFHFYNHNHMSRVQPTEKRTLSKNYNPVLAWSMGCQLVALNRKSKDSQLLVNNGFFRRNGNCGYVLKSGQWNDHAFQAYAFYGEQPVWLTIRVLNGSCLPKPGGKTNGEYSNPFVEVTLYDVDYGDLEEVTTSNLTCHVDGNGYNPMWNDQFEFSVKNETAATLLFSVRDMPVRKGPPVVSAAIPVAALRKGYRRVQLFDADNIWDGFASLFIEVQMERKFIEAMPTYSMSTIGGGFSAYAGLPVGDNFGRGNSDEISDD